MLEYIKTHKARIYPVVLIFLMFVVYKYRENKNSELQFFSGETMGTTYNIKYLHTQNYQKEIDSILVEVNQSLSTYIPESEISMFNQTGELEINSRFFYPVLSKSKEIFKNSNGAFDPTVMPLVNAWGFGFQNKQTIDSTLIDSLLNFVGFEKIEFAKSNLKTSQEGVMLDFSAIAKGYGVDVVSDYLKSKNILHFMVEIGGEVRCSGKNQDENIWKIGIDNPSFQEEGGEQLAQIIELDNVSLATSGNYRNFYEDENGIKRAHTISPKTGYPVSHSLLSASVKTKGCMSADGYATALMVLGFEESKQLVNSINDTEAFLIYDNNGKLETWSSDNFFDNE